MSIPIYRTASEAEIAAMLDWAAAEGWNPGLDDAAAFRAADPGGFFVADLAGQPVAAISVVNHNDSFAFLGLYLCRPEYRGKGIGYGLWTHAMAHAGTRSIGLDGVPAQEANYARSGFQLSGRTRRFCGTFAAQDSTPPTTLATGITPDDFDQIAALDLAANGFARPRFLRGWLEDGASRRTLVSRTQGHITGIATARLCRSGGKIGPILAPNATVALDLARQAAASLGGRDVVIDLPDQAAAFRALLEQAGFEETFVTARMYRGPAPVPAQGTMLQAIATMELG